MPIGNDFVANIRDTVNRASDEHLTTSLVTSGWNKNLPAIKDEHGVLLVGNRRMRIALANGITPVIATITFGDGPQADIERAQLAVVSNVGGATLTIADRKRIAVQLYGAGMTQAAISKIMGVSQQTVSLDLGNLPTAGNSPRPKTATNPKGAGRPKGSGTKPKTAKPKAEPEPKPKPEPKPAPVKTKDVRGRVAVIDIRLEPQVWNTFHSKAREEGKTASAKIGELVTRDIEPTVDPATLSPSAQEKLAAAIRQATRKLEAEIKQREHEESQRWLAALLVDYRRKEAHYNIIMSQHRGVVDKAGYNLILSCLHTDSRNSASDDKLNRAFHLWTNLERAVLKVADTSVKHSNLPQTREELMKRRAEYDARRAAERAARKNNRTGVAR